MSEQDFVTVPQFTFSTIQNILEINSVLLKILTEYQNNGWVDQPEFLIYHKRLGTNLKFLAASADLLKKNIDLPDLTPVSLPSKLENGIFQGIKPPTMVQDSKKSYYVPIQPFMPPKEILEHIPPQLYLTPTLSCQTAQNALKRRLQSTELYSDKRQAQPNLLNISNISQEILNDEDEDDADYVPETILNTELQILSDLNDRS